MAIADYGGRLPAIPSASTGGDAFASLFDGPDRSRGDHIGHNGRLTPTATAAEVRSAIAAWGASAAEVGLLLWCGHCERDALGQAFVHASDAPIAVGTLADWVSAQRFRTLLVIVDGYFAGAAVDGLDPLLDRAAAGSYQACVLVASSNDLDPADAGRFTTTLAGVLASGPNRGWWSWRDRFLVVTDVTDRLDEELDRIDSALVGVRPKLMWRGRLGRIFPNPLYGRLRALAALDEAHFLPKARGIDTDETGWHFTGRVHVLRRIVTWLSAPGNGMFVVTGPPGSGKSAVLGRVVTMSAPHYRRLAKQAGEMARAAAGTVPPEGVIAAAFHARDKRLDQLLDFLGQALGLGAVNRIAEFIDALRARAEPAVFVVDALDEAVAGHAERMVAEVLAPLARVLGVKVLVGTRPDVVRWREVEAPVVVFDLASEPGTQADIAAYATDRLLRLEGSAYAGDPDRARRVGEGVAAGALADPEGRRVGSFLVARELTRALAYQLPATLELAGIAEQVATSDPRAGADVRYRQSLEIKKGLGDIAGMAIEYHNLGVVAQARGDYDEAEDRFREALDIQQRLGDLAGTATNHNNLGVLAQARGDYDEAEDRFRQSLEIKKGLGDIAGMAIEYHNLGVLAQARGDYDEAEDRFRQSLEIKKGLGDIAGMAIEYHNLGVLAQARGDYDEAEDRFRQSLEIKNVLGDAEEARQLHEQTYETRRRVLGPEHPDTLTSANSLAVTRSVLGDAEGARQLYEQTYEARRRVLGPEHPDTLTSADSLAVTRYVLGDAEGARQLYEQTYETRRRVLGPEHPDTLTSADSLAVTRYVLGDAEGARQLHEQTYETRRRVLGPEHPDTLTSASNLAETRRVLGEA